MLTSSLKRTLVRHFHSTHKREPAGAFRAPAEHRLIVRSSYSHSLINTEQTLAPGGSNHFLFCQGVSRTAYASALAACNACSEHRANGCAVSSCAEARVPAASILSKNVSEVCTTSRRKKTRVCGASQHAAAEHRPVGGMIYAYLCAREHPCFSLRGCVECHGCEYPSLPSFPLPFLFPTRSSKWTWQWSFH